MSTTPDISEQILDVANRLFAARGYEGTSLQAIASEVGIRKPSLLYHYQSKDTLRTAVLNRLMEHWNQVLPQILEAATSGDDRFDSLVGEVVAFFTQDLDRARLLYREILDRPDAIRDALKAFLGPWLNVLADYIHNGKADGSVRPDIDPEAYILSVIQMIVGGLATSDVFGSLFDDASLERQTAELTRIARTSLFTSHYLAKRYPQES